MTNLIKNIANAMRKAEDRRIGRKYLKSKTATVVNSKVVYDGPDGLGDRLIIKVL